MAGTRTPTQGTGEANTTACSMRSSVSPADKKVPKTSEVSDTVLRIPGLAWQSGKGKSFSPRVPGVEIIANRAN